MDPLAAVAEERFSLKDHLFNEDKVSHLAGLLEGSLSAGDALEFSVSASARDDERLIIDYVVDFVERDGASSTREHMP